MSRGARICPSIPPGGTDLKQKRASFDARPTQTTKHLLYPSRAEDFRLRAGPFPLTQPQPNYPILTVEHPRLFNVRIENLPPRCGPDVGDAPADRVVTNLRYPATARPLSAATER